MKLSFNNQLLIYLSATQEMKIKSGFSHAAVKQEEKKLIDNQYRKKLQNLVPGNVLLPSNCGSELKAVRPPVKNFRIIGKNNKEYRNFLQPNNSNIHNEFQQPFSLHKNAKKNAQLLGYMMDILDHKQIKQKARVKTEVESFNEFFRYPTPQKNIKGPLLDPRISKFYNNKHHQRPIFSEQKYRKHRKVEFSQRPISNQKNIKNPQLITFYKKASENKDESINEFI